MSQKQKFNKVSKKVLIKNLSSRQKTVLDRRFGLTSGERETLESIGKTFGVTRERIRQIESDAFSKLKDKKDDPEVREVFADIDKHLKKKGGLHKEDKMLSELGGEECKNHVKFFLTLADKFNYFSGDNKFDSYWYNRENVKEEANKILNNTEKALKKERGPLSFNKFIELANSYNTDKETFLSSMEATKRVGRGPLGCYGLVDWLEINPSGVRDRAFLALKHKDKPLHFRKIAEVASSLEGDYCEKKQVLPQTVHNELIRDKRFVLVGRGLYALKEWGYKEGTVKEIIADTLESSNQPLEKDEVVAKAKEQRLVKKSTILLNLNNEDYFDQDDEGRYRLKRHPREA